jgi:hypothetical protein
MPIISWSAGDVLQSKTAPANTYPVVLAKFDGPKASSSGKGINLFLTFRVIDGDWANKEFTIALSSGVNNGSVLGGLQFVPMGATMAQIAAAIKGNAQVEVNSGSADLDEMLNQSLDLNIGVETIDGKLVNVINSFLPAGSANRPTPF